MTWFQLVKHLTLIKWYQSYLIIESRAPQFYMIFKQNFNLIVKNNLYAMPILKAIKRLNAQFLHPKLLAISPCLSYLAFLNNQSIQVYSIYDLIRSFDSYCQRYELTSQYTFTPSIIKNLEIEVSIDVHKFLIGLNLTKPILVWTDLAGNTFIRELQSVIITKLMHPEKAPAIALNLNQNKLLIHFYSADYFQYELKDLKQGKNIVIQTRQTGYSPFDKMVNIFPGIFYALNYLIVDQFQLPFKSKQIHLKTPLSRKSAVVKNIKLISPKKINSYQRRKSIQDSLISDMSQVNPKQPNSFIYKRKYLVIPSPCQLFNIQKGIHKICQFNQYDFGAFSPFQYKFKGKFINIFITTKQTTLELGALSSNNNYLEEIFRITNLKSQIRMGGWISPYEVILLDETGVVLLLSLDEKEIGQVRQ